MATIWKYKKAPHELGFFGSAIRYPPSVAINQPSLHFRVPQHHSSSPFYLKEFLPCWKFFGQMQVSNDIVQRISYPLAYLFGIVEFFFSPFFNECIDVSVRCVSILFLIKKYRHKNSCISGVCVFNINLFAFPEKTPVLITLDEMLFYFLGKLPSPSKPLHACQQARLEFHAFS